jgi:hypothetical protein
MVSSESGGGPPVIPLCPCCGDPNWHHQHPHLHHLQQHPAAAAGFYPMRAPMPQQQQHQMAALYHHQHQMLLTSSAAIPPLPPLGSAAASAALNWHQEQQRQHHQMTTPLQPHPYHHPQRLQLSSEDVRYAAHSDGEAERSSRSQSLRRRQSASAASTEASAALDWRMVASQTPHYVTMTRATAMAIREDSRFQLMKGPTRYSSQPFLTGERSLGALTVLGSNILDFNNAPTTAPLNKAKTTIISKDLSLYPRSLSSMSSRPPPPTASKSQLDRLNYRTSAVMPAAALAKFQNGENSSASSGIAGSGTTSNSLSGPPPPPLHSAAAQKVQQQQPRYQQPVSQQNLTNQDYLFPGEHAMKNKNNQ